MSQPLLTAVAPRWETTLVGALARSTRIHVARRCADVAELVGSAAAGIGRVAVVSADLRGLDRAVVDTLHRHGLSVLGVHPPDDEGARRTLHRWGIRVVVAGDAPAEGLDRALEELLEGNDEAPTDDSPSRSGSSDPRREVSVVSSSDVPGRLDGSAGPPQRLGHGAPAPVPETGNDGMGGRPTGTPPQDGGTGDEEPVPALPDEGPGQVVVVWGPTGSPGRTTVAVNLAAELADPLSSVLLVDADTYGASAAQMLAVLDEVPGVAAAARAADQGALDHETLARLAPQVRPGLRILTGLPRADRWPELRDMALADVLEQARHLARWVVVDVAAPLEQDEELSFDTFAPRRNGATLTALDVADRVVVVGTGDPVGLQRLVRGLDLLGGCTQAPRTVVVTRVRPGPVGPEPGRRIQETLHRFASTGPVHLVPEDQDALDVALLQGRALLEVRPRSAARMALVELADIVADRAVVTRRRRAGIRSRWFLPGRAETA